MNKFFRANAALSVFAKNYTELKRNLPIRPSEMGVLNIISETNGIYTPIQLAELLCVTKQMITCHIRSLESKGYIIKKPSSQDKRAYYIIPTNKALELVKWAKNDLNGKLEELVSKMGADEFNKLVELAEKANNAMKENKAEK